MELSLTTRKAFHRLSDFALWPYRAVRSPIFTLAKLLNWGGPIRGIGDSVVRYDGPQVSQGFHWHRTDEGGFIGCWRGWNWTYSPWSVCPRR